jgi:hypothetical protein
MSETSSTNYMFWFFISIFDSMCECLTHSHDGRRRENRPAPPLVLPICETVGNGFAFMPFVPFAKEVWNLVRSWAGECIQTNMDVQTIQEWWQKWLQGQDAMKQRPT